MILSDGKKTHTTKRNQRKRPQTEARPCRLVTCRSSGGKPVEYNCRRILDTEWCYSSSMRPWRMTCIKLSTSCPNIGRPEERLGTYPPGSLGRAPDCLQTSNCACPA